ncbi:hypothetical protein VP01_2088g4 [Puccinia sorghi]|uniref:Uncharacterized protein n=1 Tax=Puccinia sorghi TaxID=27349 RepID=A0A0L6VC62_9BASI|nr:hypothetical protein VP01_2088g4 [Puccinia sorghi]
MAHQLICIFVHAELKLQPIAFLSKKFPPKYVSGDHLLHVWHKLRNILLTGINIHVSSGDTSMTAIVGLPLEIDIKMHLRICFCYLCLATAANHFDAQSCNVSQWDQIDMQLNANCSESLRYTNCWNQILSAKDAKLFGDRPFLSELKENKVKCPTHDEGAGYATPMN